MNSIEGCGESAIAGSMTVCRTENIGMAPIGGFDVLSDVRMGTFNGVEGRRYRLCLGDKGRCEDKNCDHESTRGALKDMVAVGSGKKVIVIGLRGRAQLRRVVGV
jgi:hypothetical protein